jgi:hypothetical protein
MSTAVSAKNASPAGTPMPYSTLLIDADDKLETVEVRVGKLTRPIVDVDAHHNVSTEVW